MDDSQCNKQTGQCDGGCKPGYTNADCSKGECIYYLLNDIQYDKLNLFDLLN